MNYIRFIILSMLIISMLSSFPAQAKLQEKIVQYKQNTAVLEGYLAYDDSIKGKRPGILIAHEWWGINDYVNGRARQLAKLGYIAFVADIYGKGIRPKTPQDAGKQAGIYRSDRKLMRERIKAGLKQLREHKLTDSKRIAAIGYCFGGGAVLELARSGADIAGVVSFHGSLDTPNPKDAKSIKAKILVQTGADDPSVPLTQIVSFESEMRAAKVDWYMITYGNAVHSFTNPASGDDPSKGVSYNEKADKRSWEAMLTFFDEIFAKKVSLLTLI